MSSAKIRLGVAAVLFACWLGWLGYLALTKANPLIVARSQIMAAEHFVLVEVAVDAETGRPNLKQNVKENLKSRGPAISGEITIANLREARIAGQREAIFKPGTVYFLALTRMTDDIYTLTPPPKAPGNEALDRGRPWAYPWNPAVQKQFEQLTP